MRSVPQAMTWELFSNSRWGLPCALLGGQALPWLLLAALRKEGAFDSAEESHIVIHIVIALINATTFGTAIMSSQGHPKRLYTFPVSSATLVAWQMLPAMAVLFVESVLSMVLLNAVFKLDWPIWGPALFMACGLAAVQGVMWLTEKSVWLIFAVSVVGSVGGLWFMSRYGIVLGRPAHLWRDVTPAEMLTMLAAVALSYRVAVAGVSRDRCGEGLHSEALRAWIERLLDPAPAFGQPFRTPLAAQFWFDWRQKGAMPWLVAFLLAASFCGWVLFNRDPPFLLDGCLTLGYFLPIMGFVMGMVIGTSGPADGKFEMSQFLATRPITNSNLARIILKTTLLNVIGAWLVWCLTVVCVLLLLWAAGALPSQWLPAEMRWWHPLAILLGSWLTTALMSCLILCGHQRFLGAVFFGGFGLIIGGILFGKWGLSDIQREWFHQTMLVLCGTAFTVGTAWAFIAARRRVLIRSQTVPIAAIAWLTATALAAFELAWRHGQSLPMIVLLAGLAALVVAPIALTPLALAWNRHR